LLKAFYFLLFMAGHIFLFLEIFSQEGGIQSYIKEVLQAYLALPDSQNAEVFLLRDTPDCPNPFPNQGLTFRYLKNKSPTLARFQLALNFFSYLLWKRPQRVFCGHINLSPLIRLCCQPLGIPYTLLTYGKEVWEPLTNTQKQALQAAESIWTISRYSRDRLCEANNINPEKVAILPCVVDEEIFNLGEKSLTLIKKYAVENAKVLLTVARLWSGDIYKGVDVTIRALPKILRSYPDVKYLVIGRGDDRPRLEALTKELEVDKQVIFAGFVPTEELADHYRLASAYVMPSQEGFGIVYLEAMACGIPVVSGDEDGSADPLQDGRVGWRVPYRDPEKVAQACLEILQGEDIRCDPQWLRQQTLAKFSKKALQAKLQQLIAPL
jgi:glycosyltransferase involved in cell wall biosynthesis